MSVYTEDYNGETQVLTIRVGRVEFSTFRRDSEGIVRYERWHWTARSPGNFRHLAKSAVGLVTRQGAERAMRNFIEAVTAVSG